MFRGTAENHEKPVTLIFFLEIRTRISEIQAQTISLKHAAPWLSVSSLPRYTSSRTV